jgi:hypothetical protein
MKILLGIEGGIGKGIAATGAVAIAAQEHEIDIITAHPSVWEGNPHVGKVWDWNRAEYLDEAIKVYDRVIFDDPYKHTQFLLNDCDITCTYNYMLNNLCQPVKPQLFLNKAEHMFVKGLLKDIEKPIFVVQTNGGLNEGYAWNRDIPLEEAVEILNQFGEEYEIIHLRANGQLEIGGIKHTGDLNLRQSLVVLAMSEKRLLIDSVYQHAAAAMDLPSTVLWVQTEPSKFGYELHTNILCDEPALNNMNRLGGLFGGLDSDPSKCPFAKDQKIFDTQKIIESLKLSGVAE